MNGSFRRFLRLHPSNLTLVLFTSVVACILSAASFALYVDYLQQPSQGRIGVLDIFFPAMTWLAAHDRVAASLMAIIVSYLDPADIDRHMRGGGAVSGAAVGLVTGGYLVLRRCIFAVRTRLDTKELAVILQVLPICVLIFNFTTMAVVVSFWPRLLGFSADPSRISVAVAYAVIFLIGSFLIFGILAGFAYWGLIAGFRVRKFISSAKPWEARY